jgi:hypothetical protein
MEREQRALESIVLIRQILGTKAPIDRVLEIVRKAGTPGPGAQVSRETRVS